MHCNKNPHNSCTPMLFFCGDVKNSELIKCLSSVQTPEEAPATLGHNSQGESYWDGGSPLSRLRAQFAETRVGSSVKMPFAMISLTPRPVWTLLLPSNAIVLLNPRGLRQPHLYRKRVFPLHWKIISKTAKDGATSGLKYTQGPYFWWTSRMTRIKEFLK